jgi:ketosteroid isomerase-like protein
MEPADSEPIDVPEAGDMTIEFGRYAPGLELEGGEQMTDVGKYLVVHETRADGSTKILMDCFNSNSPPPG